MTPPVKHYTASAFILSDTQPAKALLLHHRKYDKWMMPGGHQETSENPVEAAIREVEEETGLDISAYLTLIPLQGTAKRIPVPNYMIEALVPAYGDEPEHYHLDQIYVVRLPEQAVRHSLRESHNIGWFSLEQLADLPMFPNVYTLLKQELTV